MVYFLRVRDQGRLHRNKLILSDLENWINKTRFASMSYREGKYKECSHKEPKLDYKDKVVKELQKHNAHILWENGKDALETLKNEGREAINTFHTIIDEATEDIPLEKLCSYGARARAQRGKRKIR